MPTAAAPPSAIAGVGVSNKGVAAAAVMTAIDSGSAIFIPLRFRSIGEVGNRKASKQESDISTTTSTIITFRIVDMAVVSVTLNASSSQTADHVGNKERADKGCCTMLYNSILKRL